MRKTSQKLRTLAIEPPADTDPVKDGHPRKVTKASALPTLLLTREPRRETGRTTHGERSPRSESIVAMESTPVLCRMSALRGACVLGGPEVADRRKTNRDRGWCESDGHPNARTHVSVTTECSGRIEPGLSLLSPREREATLGSSVSSAGVRPQGRSAARSFRCASTGGERVWLRPAHARGTKLSRGESALRVVLQKSSDDVELKEAHIAKAVWVNGS